MGSLLAWLVLVLAPADQPCLVIDAMDQLRASAHARHDVNQLHDLYVDGRVAAADVAMLEQYAERDLRLVRMRIERSACTAQSRGRVTVTERLAETVVEFPDGSRRALPADAWATRTIRLVHAGRWRISEVRTDDGSTRTP